MKKEEQLEPLFEIKTSAPLAFDSLKLEKKTITGIGGNRYRVYRQDGSFVIVEAESAADAFRESGVTDPEKIIHESLFLHDGVLDRDILSSVGGTLSRTVQKMAEAEHAIAAAKRAALAEQGVKPPQIAPSAQEPSVEDLGPTFETDFFSAVPIHEPAPAATPVETPPKLPEPDHNRELSQEEIEKLLQG